MPSDRLDSPFARPVLVWLVAVAACSLALTVVLIVAKPEGPVESSGADAFSRSALGHRAFVDLLRAAGVPVMVSRYASAERAGGTALLLLAEPRFESDDAGRARRLQDMLRLARATLLVLPKWSGLEDPRNPGWLESVELLPEAAVSGALRAAHVPAAVARPGRAGPERCEGTSGALTWKDPQLLVPESSALRPLIGCPGGVLLGELALDDGRRLLVLSDPDPISNHGLGQDQNARLALDVIAHARHGAQVVVVDETLHGHERIPSLWRELFVFPLLPSVIQAALALLALVWSGMGRFGAPLPASGRLASGKDVLIDNTASLLRTAGHSAHTLGRYFDAAFTDVVRTLHAPARAGDQYAWLQGVGRRRGVRVDLAVLRGQVERARRQDAPSASAIVSAARRIHRWRLEMLRGPQDDPGR